jgi:hypothetical protein
MPNSNSPPKNDLLKQKLNKCTPGANDEAHAIARLHASASGRSANTS